MGIQAKDLRIGNLILVDIGLPSLDIHSVKSSDFLGIATGDHHVEGIHLTEEWLIKLGFEKSEFGDFVIGIDNGWTIVYQSCNYIYFKYRELEVEVSHFKYEYVHQLQNLYHDLTGEELEVK